MFASRVATLQLSSWLVCGLGACFASTAQAYCRANACEATEGCERDPDSGCQTGGAPLHRPSRCLYVGFGGDVSARVSRLAQSEFERVVMEAFERWRQVDCGGGSPGFVARSVGTLNVDSPFGCFGLETGNVNTFMVRKDDAPRGVTANSGAQAGTTELLFSEASGALYDADVTVDALWLSVQPEDAMLDHLRVVALHEAGHVLGLDHTSREEAVMYEAYPVLADRELTDDDVAGICAL